MANLGVLGHPFALFVYKARCRDLSLAAILPTLRMPLNDVPDTAQSFFDLFFSPPAWNAWRLGVLDRFCA